MPGVGTKPALPTLNLSKVKGFLDDVGDSPRQPSSTRRGLAGKQARTTRHRHSHQTNLVAGQAGSLGSHRGEDASTSGHQHGTYGARVPKLNLGQHEGLGLGTSGGIDSSVSARMHGSSTAHLQPRSKQGAFTARMVASSKPPHGSQHAHAVAATHAQTHIQAAASHVRPTAHAQGTDRGESQASAKAAAGSATAASTVPARSGDSEPRQEGTSTAWESGAITAAQALKRYSQYMTSYEQSEILDFNDVYFVGRSGAAKVHGNPSLTKCNYGYDDDRGDYNVVLHDHLRFRYEVLSIMGKGSFGQVLKCHDFRTNELVAIKIIRNKKRFHHQAMVELKVLKYLVQEDPEHSHNVVHMHDFFTFRSHLCIAFEPLSINLYEFLKQNNFAGLSLGLIRRFAQQMLVALKFMRDLRIIHCDLKPENVMLRHPNRSIIKVIDFGSSCMTDERIYTYIQSRFYRAPEVILGLKYGTPIDMWSFGCILAELYSGYPLFPGEDESEQLQCIMELLNVPSRALLSDSTRAKLFFDSELAPRLTVNSQGKVHTPGTKTLAGSLKCSDAGFLDLLSGCFTWDPAKRLTPEEALAHPWMQGDDGRRSSHLTAPSPGATLQRRGSLKSLAAGGQHSTAQAHATAAAAGSTKLSVGSLDGIGGGAAKPPAAAHAAHASSAVASVSRSTGDASTSGDGAATGGVAAATTSTPGGHTMDAPTATASTAALLTSSLNSDTCGSLTAMSIQGSFTAVHRSSDASHRDGASELARRVLEEQTVTAAATAGAHGKALQPTMHGTHANGLRTPSRVSKAGPACGSPGASGVLFNGVSSPRGPQHSPRTPGSSGTAGVGGNFLPTLGLQSHRTGGR